MARDTRSYVNSCEACPRNKPTLQHKAGLFMLLETPSQRWDTVTMDIIVQLPKTAKGFDAITVFVDKISKQVHFCAIHTSDTATDKKLSAAFSRFSPAAFKWAILSFCSSSAVAFNQNTSRSYSCDVHSFVSREPACRNSLRVQYLS